MNKEEVANIGFEIVAYSGDARTKLLLAVKAAKEGRSEEFSALVAEAKELLADAHKSQFSLLTLEAQGKSFEIGFIMVHAQDHLMTTILLSDIVDTLADIYR